MRSLFDPLPRPLSTKTLGVLVGLVVLGTGVAVARFLEYAPTPVLERSGTVWAAPRAEPGAAPRPVRAAGVSGTAEDPSACEASPSPACSASRTMSSSTRVPPSETPALFEAPAPGS